MFRSVQSAFRKLGRAPSFAAVALGTLALGIGATTTIFSVIDAALLRPLPYPDSERIVRISSTQPERNHERVPLSLMRYELIRDGATEFIEDISGHLGFASYALSGRGEPEQITGMLCTRTFFTTLGLKPILGRLPRPEEDAPGGPDVVVITHGLWQRRFAGDASIVGQSLTLNGRPHTVVGVMPDGLAYPYNHIALWMPKVFAPQTLNAEQIRRGATYLQVTARLKSGVTVEQFNRALATLLPRYAQEWPNAIDATYGLAAIPFRTEIAGDQGKTYYLLFAAVGLVLLIACTNVANMMLTRLAARRREVAVRTALGANRAQLVRQFVSESLVLTTLGGVLGMLLASWWLSVIVREAGEYLPRSSEFALDWRAAVFTVGICALCGIALGCVPGWQATRDDSYSVLKDGARGSSGGPAQNRFRNVLLAVEVALSLLLLSGAALLITSYLRVQRVNPGFRTEELYVGRVSLSETRFPGPDTKIAVMDRLLQRLENAPGVTHAALSMSVPFAGYDLLSPYAPADRALPPFNERPLARVRTISPGYFAALGMTLLEGRNFNERDRRGGPRVMIVNETFAKRLDPTGRAVGKRIQQGIDPEPTEIVGVVRDIQSVDLISPPEVEGFYPIAQRPFFLATVTLRSTGGTSASAATLRAVLRELDPDMPVIFNTTMDQLLKGATADRRLIVMLLAAFAGVALALAAVGVAGVVGFIVAQRTGEIGIRMALGASPQRILKMVMTQSLRPVLWGIGSGLVAALALGKVIENQLYQTSATDPWLLGGMALTLLAVAAGACLIPARAATKVDPLIALRAD